MRTWNQPTNQTAKGNRKQNAQPTRDIENFGSKTMQEQANKRNQDRAYDLRLKKQYKQNRRECASNCSKNVLKLLGIKYQFS